MKRKIILLSTLGLLFAFFIGLSFTAQASPPMQGAQYQTPTPQPDGRIIYIVQEGDTCSRIELLMGVPINELLALNPTLDANCIVIPGQELMIGIGGPSEPPTITPGGPTMIPPTAQPTATPFNGTTEICVILFEDVNGDGIRQETESGLAGGAISVVGSKGEYSQTRDSLSQFDLDGDPVYVCFGEKPPDVEVIPDSEKLPEGKYTVSAAIPDGYNPTSNLSYELEILAGERAFVGFGAQTQSGTINTTAEEEESSSPLLGIVGVALLLGAGGLAWYASRMKKDDTRRMRY